MRDLFTALQAVIAGIAVTAFIYWALNFLLHRLPEKAKRRIEPYVFIGPVLLLIGLFVIWPTLQSIRLSFMEEAIDGSTTWVGLQNFRDLIESFWGDKKKFNQAVMVTENDSTGIQKLGFITQSDLASMGLPGKIAVYLPHSYAFSGVLIIVPKEKVTPLDAPSADIMKFIVSGGVSGKNIAEETKKLN